MLVNNIYDLANIKMALHRNYALSSNIDASETKTWYKGSGFTPLQSTKSGKLFYGDFDGNGFTIYGLNINRPK